MNCETINYLKNTGTFEEKWQDSGLRNENGEEIYFGEKGEYGKIALGHLKKEQRRPFGKFAPQIKGDKIVIDLEAKNTYQNIDPENKIFKYTIAFLERIRKFLCEADNPEKFFMVDEKKDDTYTKFFNPVSNENDDAYSIHFKLAMEAIELVSIGEITLAYMPEHCDDNYHKNLQKEVSTAHREICLIEYPNLPNEYKKIEKFKENLKKEYGSDYILEKYYASYRDKLENLYKKAVNHYNKNNGELDIQ